MMDGHARVRVVHGIGTGALRAAVREWLQASAMVSRWSPSEGRTAEGDGRGPGVGGRSPQAAFPGDSARERRPVRLFLAPPG